MSLRQFPLPRFTQEGTAVSTHAAGMALSGFTSSCCTWGWWHHPACSDSDPLPQVCSRGRGPAHPTGAAPEPGSTQPGHLHSAAAKIADAPTLGISVQVFSQHTWTHHVSWKKPTLKPPQMYYEPVALSESHFPESPVLFRLCSDKKNAIITQVQTRTAHQHVSPLIKHTEWITMQWRVIQNFLMFPFSPDWGWEKRGHAPLTSEPGPGTSSVTLDNISHLLGKQGHTARRQAFLLVSASFFVCVCCWVALTAVRVSQGQVSGYNKTTSMVGCEGRGFPSQSLFSQQLCLPKSTPRAFTTSCMTTFPS